MKKVNFRVRNFEKERFLTYNIHDDARLDEEVLDFLEDEEPKGIVSIIYDEEEECDTFSYDITGKICLSELSKQDINAEMVLRVMRGLVLALIDMGEYRVPLSYLVLNRDFIYVDSNYEVEFICIPVEEMQETVDLNKFLRDFVASLRFEPSENGDYVAKMLTYINNTAIFNLRNMLNLVEHLMESNGVEIPEDADTDLYVDYQEIDEDEEVVEDEESESVVDVVEAMEELEDDEEDDEEEAEEIEESEESESAETESAVDVVEAMEELEDDEEDDEEGAEEIEESESAVDVVEAMEEIEDEEDSEEEAEEIEESEESESAETESAVDVVEAMEELEDDEEDGEEEVEGIEESEESESAETESAVDVVEAMEELEDDEEDGEEEVEEIEESEESESAETESAVDVVEAMEEIEDEEDSEEETEEIEESAESESAVDVVEAMGEIEGEEDSEEKAEEIEESAESESAVDVVEAMEALEDDEQIDEKSERDVDSEVQEILEKAKQEAKKTKKPMQTTLKTKEMVTPTRMYGDDLDEILAELEKEELKAKTGKSSLKIKREVKVNRASIVLSNQEELKEAQETQESVEVQVEEVQEPVQNQEQPKKKTDIPKVNPYIIRVNTEERVMITKQNFKIGKASMGVDYRVRGNGAVSRVHAIITNKDDVYYIKDNKSTNHTIVNGKVLEDGDSEMLVDDCTIFLGDEEFVFKMG